MTTTSGMTQEKIVEARRRIGHAFERLQALNDNEFCDVLYNVLKLTCSGNSVKEVARQINQEPVIVARLLDNHNLIDHGLLMPAVRYVGCELLRRNGDAFVIDPVPEDADASIYDPIDIPVPPKGKPKPTLAKNCGDIRQLMAGGYEMDTSGYTNPNW